MGLRPPGELTRFLVFLLVLLFGPATVKCELAPIRLSTPLTIGFAPLDLVVTVVVPRADNNREVCIYVILDGESQESCWSVNGANDRVEWQRKFRRLPPGDYAIIGVLRRTDRVLYSKPVKLLVRGE